MNTARPTRLVAVIAAVAIAGAALTAPSASARTDPSTASSPAVPTPMTPTTPTTPAVPDEGQRARDALSSVRAILAPVGRGEQRGAAPAARAGGDLTMALRELANTRSALSGAEREAADALLRRPTDPSGDQVALRYGAAKEARPVCRSGVCVHYVRTGVHRPSLRDADRNGVPDYVDIASRTFARIHDTYLRSGYRAPKPDGNAGGDKRIDVYLGDIGDRGIYGYCTSDEPETQRNRGTYDRWAFCVLDDDYAGFPSNTPVENLQVTAAHEYFHATQFAYDRYEDTWLLEATAAWVEDEMYDGVDDNLQYLARSPLTQPGAPLDTFDPTTGFHYGTWTYIRHLTETYRQKKGALPRFVLDVFKRADGARGAPDLYSWRAIDAVLRTKKTTGAASLGAYAVANRRPGASYDEARANRWPTAPLGLSRTLSPGRRAASARPRLDHLSTWTGRFTPSDALAKQWRLRVGVDMAPTKRGSRALVTVYTGAGKSTSRVRLGAQGNGAAVVGFASARVKSVEVTLVNGSGRFDCFEGSPFSCSGRPLDDNLVAKVSVRAFR